MQKHTAPTHRAIHRFASIGPRKVRLVVDMIRGTDVNKAFEILRFSHKRAAHFVEKVLRSAVANAAQDPEVNVNRLVVCETFVDSGPLLQGRLRFRPGPMGRAHPIRKRTCHIHVVLGEEAQAASSSRGTKKSGARNKAAAGQAKSGASKVEE
jgi:large subunit ribosomal protein L22